MSCAAAAVVRACPRGEAFSGRLGSRSHRSFLRKIVKPLGALVNPPHTRGRCGGSPHRATPRPQTSNRTSRRARARAGHPSRAAPTPLPRAVPPKDHALLLLPPASVPPSLSASLAPRWPHGATDRAQTSSFSNLFFFVSPPLFLSLLLRPSSLFLPLFFPHAPEARTDQTRSLLLSQNSLFPAAAPSSRPSVSALLARLSRACAATARARPQCNLLRLRRRGRLGGRR